jgi:hypothetical protein
LEDTDFETVSHRYASHSATGQPVALHTQGLLWVKTRSYRTATLPSASPQSTDINDRDILTLGNVNALSKGKLSASSQINAPRSTAAC